jgi:hypothetical protein
MTTTYPGTLDSFTTNTDGVDDVTAADMNNVQDAITALETELGTDPAGSLTNLKTRLAVALSNAGLLNFAASTALTIAAGVITATQNWHRIDTESSAASDNLDTVTAGADGQVLIVRTTADARDVVIRHNVGNIVCAGGGNITLGVTSDLALLIYDDNIDKWICVGFLSLATANTWTGANQFDAAFGHKFTSVNADTTLDGTHHTVGVDASGAARTITLPTAVGITGREYAIIKTDAGANAVTVDGNGAETINGSANKALAAQYDFVRVVSDGTNWLIIG